MSRVSHISNRSSTARRTPATAFASKDTVSIGVTSVRGTRNVPTLLNVKFGTPFFWDGRARTLEEQAKQPLLNVAEMGLESEASDPDQNRACENGSAAQQWQIIDVGGGYVKIIARHSGKAMDVAGGSTADLTQIHQWDYVGIANQQWLLRQVP